MPYKVTLTGKHKITGDLERAIETFQSYHRADFPSGTLPLALPFPNYLGAMTAILADMCGQLWTDESAKNELYAIDMTYQEAWNKEGNSHYAEMVRYKLLDFIVDHVSSESLSILTARARQLIIDNKEELFL
ncbi:MAG: hypothetical protein ACRDPY_12220 [Streptosporangiaceae bacterium]